MLSIRNLHVRYGSLEVISDFSVEVDAGEFFTLLGPSGCGKTTLLYHIAGFSPVASGRIFLDGLEITDLPPERRDVGLVFQSYALFPHMSVFENIAFGLRAARMGAAQISSAVGELLRATDLDVHRHKYPDALSGGQQQRCAIARSLAMKTKVLLFDEPLSNLDAKVRVNMRREIKRLQRELGFTAIFVTHDREEALSLSDRILVLNDGRIEQIGTGRELYTAPRTRFVCQLIGDSNELSEGFVREHFPDVHVPGASHFIRPEALGLSPAVSAVRLHAAVRDVDYLGSHTRIVAASGGEELLVDCRADTLPELQVGQSLDLYANSADVTVFPA